MSTGKRLAKRSIVGTRVCAKWDDDIFYSGVIQAVKTPSEYSEIHTDTTYAVRFDEVPVTTAFGPNEALFYKGITSVVRTVREFRDVDLIGPGFRTMAGISLKDGQKVFLTFNGREVSGLVVVHSPEADEVVVNITPTGHEGKLEVKKRLEEVRLLESRKSARLMDQDTDFARLADMAGDRKRTSSHSIDVPIGQGSRKRRTSTSNDDKDPDCMNECTAALVLMSLSCSPHSPHNITGLPWCEPLSPSPSSDICSWRSGGRSPTPSPPLSEGGSSSSIWNATDEGIVIDEFDDIPKKKRPTRIVFRCTYRGCQCVTSTVSTIEHHVRQVHLGGKKKCDPEDADGLSDHEEEFYYTEMELANGTQAPVQALQTSLASQTPQIHPHKDMCRPQHEDPEYQKSRMTVMASCHPNTPWSSILLQQCQKQLKLTNGAVSTYPTSNSKYESSSWLSSSAPNKLITNGKAPGSPTRKARGETKKCRKVYGMEHRELWCTQCKWKKACSRFGD